MRDVTLRAALAFCLPLLGAIAISCSVVNSPDDPGAETAVGGGSGGSSGSGGQAGTGGTGGSGGTGGDGLQGGSGPACVPADCVDNDPCTDDICDPESGCSNPPIEPTGSAIIDFTGSIVDWVVPECVTSITIEVRGAQGGDGALGGTGGLGARMAGDFAVTAGEQFRILVGEQGAPGSSSTEQAGGTGGGGTFVVDANDQPLIVAGGGGGAMGMEAGAGCSVCTPDGGPGQIEPDGQAGGGDDGGVGGSNGGGGALWPWNGWHAGTGGGGFSGDGVGSSTGSASFGTPNGPGMAFLNGGAGGVGGSLGRNGGFGGGGAAGMSGGGGGGYSGGGGASAMGTIVTSGGGGGSINAGTNQDNAAGVNAGHGAVTITW